MSEQEEQVKGFMEKLNQWIDDTVIEPLHKPVEDCHAADCDQAREAVKKAICAKVLESYKNGCRSGAGHVRKEFANAKAKTR